MKMNIRMKLRLRMTMNTWELVEGCPVRRRGEGSLMLPDVEVWNVGWKCHREKYKTELATIRCN